MIWDTREIEKAMTESAVREVRSVSIKRGARRTLVGSSKEMARSM